MITSLLDTKIHPVHHYEKYSLDAMFPDLRPGNQTIGKVNLNDLIEYESQRLGTNNWGDAPTTQVLIDSITQQNNLLYTFGGWMEDRHYLWKNHYPGLDSKTLHLGVDINVPNGISIHSPINGKVLHVDYDGGLDVDWGGSIAIELYRNAIIFAHLPSRPEFQVGEFISVGDKLGEIGKWPQNGNVFSHLHVQAVPIGVYLDELRLGFPTLDGYGDAKNVAQLKFANPEPLKLIADQLVYERKH